MDYLAQPDIADVAQQEHGPDDLAKLYKREIQLVLAAVGAEPAQDRRRRDLAGLDGNRHPQHRRQMQLNQPPVDHIAEQRIDVAVNIARLRAMEFEVLDAPDARHELDAQEVRQREDRVTLGLGVPVNRVRSNVRFVGHQPVKDVDALIGAAGNEMAEQRDELVRYMVVADTAVPTDRKSTRLNSSHQIISYAVFCLKKKT